MGCRDFVKQAKGPCLDTKKVNRAKQKLDERRNKRRRIKEEIEASNKAKVDRATFLKNIDNAIKEVKDDGDDAEISAVERSMFIGDITTDFLKECMESCSETADDETDASNRTEFLSNCRNVTCRESFASARGQEADAVTTTDLNVEIETAAISKIIETLEVTGEVNQTENGGRRRLTSIDQKIQVKNTLKNALGTNEDP